MRKIIISILLVFLLSLVGCVQPDTETPTIPTENASTETGGSSSSETTTPASTNNSVTPATDETTNNSEPTTTEPEVVYVEVPVEVPVEVYVEVPETFSNGVWIKEFSLYDTDGDRDELIVYLVSEGDDSDYFQIWIYYDNEPYFYRLSVYSVTVDPTDYSFPYYLFFSDYDNPNEIRMSVYKSCGDWWMNISLDESSAICYRFYGGYGLFEDCILTLSGIQ